MSLFDRRRLLIALSAGGLLAACGFQPVYAPGGSAAGLLDQVRIDDPDDRNGFDLVERLEERLGRSRAPRYRLSYQITTRRSGLGITPDNVTTRYNVDGSVTFALHDQASDAVLHQGRAATFVSYSATGSTVATVTAEADAYARLMRLLADQIVNRLIASSADWSRG